MADLSSTIQTVAGNPSEVEGDAGRVRQQNIKDLIEADRYLSGQGAKSQKTLGLILRKLVPPGAVPNAQQQVTQ
jgi:hypothetical protein